MRIWIGTSGYSYPDWVGPFYPPGTSAARFLAFYARHFPVVELNFTFYRLPTPTMLARLAERAPAGFQFLVKLPRTLSHEAKLSDLTAFRYATEPLRRSGQLLGLLCQFPQACHNVPPRRAWLQTLADALAGDRLAVEFRHFSWFHPEVPAWLAERQLDLVSVDVPDLPGLYPRRLVQSTPRLYIRFHSRNAQNWYRSDKDRYDYDYEDRALREWITALSTPANRAEQVLLLFNNCQRSQAVANAQRMRELLTKMDVGWQVQAPFAAPPSGSQQRLLFE